MTSGTGLLTCIAVTADSLAELAYAAAERANVNRDDERVILVGKVYTIICAVAWAMRNPNDALDLLASTVQTGTVEGTAKKWEEIWEETKRTAQAINELTSTGVPRKEI